MLEKDLEKKVRDYAKKVGVLCYKFTAPGRRSVPDRMFIYRGKVFFIELKAKGKKPTIAQLRELTKIRGNDVVAFWTDNFETCKRVIDKIKTEQDKRYENS